MDKKKLQLGMNPSTASGRLVKDILWHRVAQHENCHQCGNPMCRDTFSIEHKIPWLDSEDPLGLYFDQDNIAFSHHSCNVASARKSTKYPEHQGRNRKPAQIAADARRTYDAAKRRKQYLRTGK